MFNTLAKVWVGLGAIGLAYLLATDKRTEKLLNKVISTYNTGRMWRAFF